VAMMRASFVLEPGRIEVGDFEVPAIRADGDVLVRMERASICGSDVHSVFHGFVKPQGVGRPGYPGHEGVGVVVDSRSERFQPGDLVLTVPVIGGCFAQFQLIQDRHLVQLPPGSDLPRLLMAQQYGTTLFAMRRFWSHGGDAGTAAVIGAGSAGLFFLQQIRQLGFAQVVVSDLRPERLAVARALGADVLVQAPHESIVSAVEDVTAGAGADLVIEAAGYDVLRAAAIDAVRVGGAVGFFGFPERYGDAPFPMYAAFRKSVRIQLASGTQNEPGLRAFRDAVEQIVSGRVDVEFCLGREYLLEEVPDALRAVRDGHAGLKAIIDTRGSS
jgi:L-iditol 2-dehydrogenase